MPSHGRAGVRAASDNVQHLARAACLVGSRKLDPFVSIKDQLRHHGANRGVVAHVSIDTTVVGPRNASRLSLDTEGVVGPGTESIDQLSEGVAAVAHSSLEVTDGSLTQVSRELQFSFERMYGTYR